MPEQPTVSVLTLGCKLNQADAEAIARRLALAGASAEAFRRRHLGRVMPVLWEERKLGLFRGLTPNYLRVYTRPDWVGDLTNKLLPTRLLALQDEGLSGEPEPVGAPSA